MGITRAAMLFILATVSVLASTLPITNPSFSTPTIVCGGGYAYEGSGGCNGVFPSGIANPEQDFNASPGFGWTLASEPAPGLGGDGLTGPNTAFFPPSFSGMPFTQAVFLQGSNANVSQVISGFSAGTSYTLNLYLGSRYASGIEDGNQTVEALLNGTVIGTWALTSFTPFTLETAAFTAGANGSETLVFEGMSTGDHTAFLSDVSISTSTTVPEPGSLVLLVVGFSYLGGLAVVKHSRFHNSPVIGRQAASSLFPPTK
jgi:hypothetical protein